MFIARENKNRNSKKTIVVSVQSFVGKIPPAPFTKGGVKKARAISPLIREVRGIDVKIRASCSS
jgi:hypothetical protein